MIKATVIVCGFGLLMSARVLVAGEWGFPSEALGQSYLSVVTQDQLDTAPRWLAEQENPPLSARKAIGKASGILNQVWDSKRNPDTRMELQEVNLTRLENEKWVWIARYEGRVIKGGSTGLPPTFEIVVLMDGRAIQPQKKGGIGK